MFGGSRCDYDQTSSSELSSKKQHFSTITTSLLSAGYHRVSDPTLSEFDKVVGGLCWAITASLITVDVDILFQPNATIKHRIKLSEDIVNVLRLMKCPHDLSAHQIQGSDFEKLLPVIKWTITQVTLTRTKLARQLSTISQFHFHKNYMLPDDLLSTATTNSLADLQKQYQIKNRKLRFTSSDVRRNTEESKVHACLLE